MASSSDYTTPLTPRIATECERCLRRISGEKNVKFITALLTSLFCKQVLPQEDIFYSTPMTLYQLADKALLLDISPSNPDEKHHYANNIIKIYSELKQQNFPLEKEEKLQFENFSRCHHYLIDDPGSLKSSKSGISRIHKEVIPIVSSIPQDLKQLLESDPLQWLLHVLNPSIPLNDVCSWKEFIHPHVLVLTYKACMNTESFLQSIHLGVRECSLTSRDKIKFHFRIIDLLSTWLRTRYFNEELQKKAVFDGFQQIIEYLQTQEREIRDELTILQVLFEKSAVITPRHHRKSFSFGPIEQLLKDMINGNENKPLIEYCISFENEISAYLIEYLEAIPLEEYFKDVSNVEETPKIAEFARAINLLEDWLLIKFRNLKPGKAIRTYEALLMTMSISFDEKRYQTTFCLLHIFKEIFRKITPLKTSRKLIAKLHTIESAFELSSNASQMRKYYQENSSIDKKYFPWMSLATRDLYMITQEVPSILHKDGIAVYNISRLNMIFKSVYPIVNFLKIANLYVPTTNLRTMVSGAFSLAGSSESISPIPPS